MRVAVAALVASFAFSTTACFDSDQTGVPEAPGLTGTFTGAPYSTTGPATSSTTESSSESGDRTCRDGLQCIITCVLTSDDPTPGPDEALECILICQEGMTSDEVLKLLRLTQCVGDQCEASGECEMLDTGTGSATGSGSGTASGSVSGSTTGPGTGLDACTSCLFAGLLDPEPPGCEEEAMACT